MNARAARACAQSGGFQGREGRASLRPGAGPVRSALASPKNASTGIRATE